MYALKEFTKLIGASFAWAGAWAWKLTTAPFLLIWWFMKSFGLAVAATPGILWRLPVRGYRRLMRLRDWVLVKVEFLQAESQRWKTTFNILKSPYSALRALGFTPQMATSLLIAGTAVGGGVATAQVLAPPSFAAGDPGVYDAPNDAPVVYNESFNTLRISLGTTPVKEILISDVTAGTAFSNSALPSGSSTSIDVGGDASVGTWLLVGDLVFERNRCDTLTLKNISTHELTVSHNTSDGQSLSPAAGTIRNRSILGGHGMAQAMSTTGGLYDRIHISPPTSGTNGQVDSLILSNLFTKGGQCRLNRIKAGSVTISLNEVGGDSDLATKAFQVEDTVTASVITLDGNTEEEMAVPATQTMDN